jgi:hypothetical protein
MDQASVSSLSQLNRGLLSSLISWQIYTRGVQKTLCWALSYTFVVELQFAILHLAFYPGASLFTILTACTTHQLAFFRSTLWKLIDGCHLMVGHHEKLHSAQHHRSLLRH